MKRLKKLSFKTQFNVQYKLQHGILCEYSPNLIYGYRTMVQNSVHRPTLI